MLISLVRNHSLFLEGYFFVAKRSQAAKRHRQGLKNRERNYSYRSRLKTFLKKARTAIEDDSADKATVVATAVRELDRMVTKGVLHKNNASRRKSRLVRASGKKQAAEAASHLSGGSVEPGITG